MVPLECASRPDEEEVSELWANELIEFGSLDGFSTSRTSLRACKWSPQPVVHWRAVKHRA
jgi:hypothetical protein